MKYLTTEKFLPVISVKSRLDIVNFLIHGEKCVSDIVNQLKLSQNLVSNHLAVLRNSQIVEARKKGLKVYYSLDKSALEFYLSELHKTIQPKK